MTGLLLRAVLAFLALPGVVAFVVPLFLLAPDESGAFNLLRGFVPLTLGVVGLLWCVREFYVAGRGTLAPWSPHRPLSSAVCIGSRVTRCTSPFSCCCQAGPCHSHRGRWLRMLSL